MPQLSQRLSCRLPNHLVLVLEQGQERLHGTGVPQTPQRLGRTSTHSLILVPEQGQERTHGTLPDTHRNLGVPRHSPHSFTNGFSDGEEPYNPLDQKEIERQATKRYQMATPGGAVVDVL